MFDGTITRKRQSEPAFIGEIKNELAHAIIDFNHNNTAEGLTRLHLIYDKLEKRAKK